MKIVKLVSLALAATLSLAGCAPAQQPIEGKVKIVASTNVWGDVAKAVGGDLVEVTSIIDDAKKDPHSYEASARDQLAVEKSNLVIANGGGYDDFIEKMAEAAGNKQIFRVASAVTAVAWQENEHLWYSISAVGEVAYAMADTLSAIDAKNAEKYLDFAENYLQLQHFRIEESIVNDTDGSFIKVANLNKVDKEKLKKCLTQTDEIIELIKDKYQLTQFS